MGRDFTLSVKVGNGQPRAVTDTGIFVGFNIELYKGYSIGLSVNGINKFQAIGMGDKYLPILLTGKYPGHKKWGDYAFSHLQIEKKSDSLLFSINDKLVLRTRILILDSSDAGLTPPSALCYSHSAFYASSNKQELSSSTSFVVDDFTLLWMARKGDELLAEDLLNKALQKYTYYSKPYFGKYIIARTMDEEQCVLNLYGNYIIPPTTDLIRITHQPGIFVKQDGGREEFYDDKGHYEEFNAARTKSLLASQKEPVFLQSQPLLAPVPLRHFNSSVPPRENVSSVLPFFRTIGITADGNKKGLRSSSGRIYYYPGFEDIWIEQVGGVDSMYSGWEDDYRVMAKQNGKTIQFSLKETNPEKLLRVSSTTFCKICKGFGGTEHSGFEKGQIVPAEYTTSSFSYNYINVYGQKWQKTYSFNVKVAEAYFQRGKKFTYRESCKPCGGRGITETRSVYLIWNAAKKLYEEKTEVERTGK